MIPTSNLLPNTQPMQPILHKKLRLDKIKNGKCPVVIQIYFNKQRKQIFSGLSIEPALWDAEKQQSTSKHHDHLFFNRMLKNKVEALEKEYFRQELTDGAININTTTRQSKKSFFDYSQAYYNGLGNKAGRHYINKSKAAIRDFKAFAGDLTFQQVTPQILKGFEDHLFDKGRARNTINFVFKKLKQPFAHANKEKVTDCNPFNMFKPVTYKQTKREYLTMDEIEAIAGVELPDVLDNIRNYALLSAFTGLRFGDLQKFDKKKFITTNKGIERIIVGTTKTGEVVSIKLSKNVKTIIDKIKKPLPSNVHTNRLLKIICQAAQVKVVSFHKFRHSAAVNMASAGLSIEVVSRILGHTDIRTTAIYYKITDSRLDEAMDKFDAFNHSTDPVVL